MNKKTKLLIVSMLSMGLCTALTFAFSDNFASLGSANRSKPQNLDCSYYFDNIVYHSIYDLNQDRLDNGSDITDVTTWGTVTCNYIVSGKNCTIVQSTDRNGNHSGTMLFNISSSSYPFSVGSVLTVKGDMTLYDGMSEMQNITSIETDYQSNPSPVEPLELTGPLPLSSDITSFKSVRYMGTREVVINNVRLSRSASNKSYVYFNDNDKIELFYGSNTKTSEINARATNLDNKNVNIHGYLNCYNSKNNPSNTSTLQVILRDADDIQEYIPDKNIDYLYVTTDKTFHYMDQVKMSDFTATIYFDDSSSMVVNDAYITSTVDTTSLGYKTVEFAYEKDGITYTDSLQIIVEDTVASIRVDSPIQYYAYYESFITPEVLGTSYYGEFSITPEVEFSGFDPYWYTDYHSNVFVDYTNSAGKQLSTSYEYFVSGVESLEIISPKLEYDLGEQFVYPEVVATYTYDSHKADVTNRVTFSGFDSSSPGEVNVTVSYGNYETSYTVEIIDTTPIELYEESVYISGIGSYDTGNYGKSGDFEYYRAVNQSGYICKLIPLTRQPDCEETLDGALYNINAFKDIDHIKFTYKTSSNSASSLPKLYYGENNYDDGSIALSCSTYNSEITIDLSSYEVNYFKFTSGNTTLYLQNINIYYSGSNTSHGSNFVYKTTGVNEYRIAPTVYSGELVDGESYVDVPVAFDVTHSTVLSTKRYTYYSYEYVYNHPEVKGDAVMTSPVDVCNYFQAFGCAPANYCYKGTVNPLRDGKQLPSTSEVNALFGDDARCISQYSKTTGYARSVPYYGSKPTYYELDIDTNGLYTTSSRQVGRIVAWSTGFTGSDYGSGSQCVCTYTDDHYATFKEFNNFGGFMSRFNAERCVAGATRGNPTTVTY